MTLSNSDTSPNSDAAQIEPCPLSLRRAAARVARARARARDLVGFDGLPDRVLQDIGLEDTELAAARRRALRRQSWAHCWRAPT